MNQTFSSLYSSVTGEAARPGSADSLRSSSAQSNGRPASSSAQKQNAIAGRKRSSDEQAGSAPALKRLNNGPERSESFRAEVVHRQSMPSLTSGKMSSDTLSARKPRPGQLQPNSAPSGASTKALLPSRPIPTGNSPGPNATKPAATAGSYAQMMAKAAQAKQLPSDANVKKDNAAPKMSLKERQARLLQEKEKAKEARKPGSRLSSTKSRGSASTTSQAKASDKTAVERIKPKRQPTDLGYKGTMRSVEPSAATAKKSSPVKRDARPVGSKPATDTRGSRYSYASESEEGYSDDEGSDDMEDNGFGALEEEEELSLRAARKEDAEALREETDHARKKAERRRQLEALKASRRK